MGTILATFVDIIDTAIPLVILFAVLFFIFGAIKLIYAAGDDSARTSGRQTMVWGIIALFFMTAIWGIVEIITRTFFTGA